MLTYLRRIRRSLVDSGSTRKYILYAIGEVLLVMIGILLALQVNNWNLNRKNVMKEKILLSQLHDEFLNNKTQLQKVVSMNQRALNRVQELIDHFPIDQSSTISDTILSYLGRARTDHTHIVGTWTFNPSNAIVNTITHSSSIDIIRNDDLRGKILRWNSVLDDYLEDESTTKRLGVERLETYLIENGMYSKGGIADSRFDFSVLSSTEFEGLLHDRAWRLRMITDSEGNRSIGEVGYLVSLIDEIIALTVNYK